MSVTAAPSLTRELEAVIARGPAECAEKLRQITNLFLETAPLLKDRQVQLFGDVFGRLMETIDVQARAELSGRLARVKNAPLAIVRQLAHEDDIAVAGPVLAQSSQLEDADLLDLAQSMGQAHLFAISCRTALDKTTTDVLVRRGDHDVVRKLAGNPDARLSKSGYCSLVERAQNDILLAQEIARRTDIAGYLFEIRIALDEMSDELEARAGPEHVASGRKASVLQESGAASDPQCGALAISEDYEETVAALAEISAVPIEVVDRLMAAERPDPVLILCKAVGLDWPTTRDLILARPGSTGISTWGLESASSDFDKLPVASAKRVVRFWQAGQEYRA
jgi:uncharacterized protein (DUF2336 family)